MAQSLDIAHSPNAHTFCLCNESIDEHLNGVALSAVHSLQMVMGMVMDYMMAHVSPETVMDWKGLTVYSISMALQRPRCYDEDENDLNPLCSWYW